MSFCTAVNCIDGRVQEPVVGFLKGRFGVRYVDMVTEAGPVGILASQQESAKADSIIARVDISVNKHKSVGIAVVAHYDCAGNPVSDDVQIEQINCSVEFIETKYPQAEVIGLWVDDTWKVKEVNA